MYSELLVCLNLIINATNGSGDTTVWLSSDCEKSYKIVLIKQKVGTDGFFYGSIKNEKNQEVYFRGEIIRFSETDTSISFSLSRYIFSYKEIALDRKITNSGKMVMHDFALPIELTGVFVGNNLLRARVTPKIAYSNFEVCFFYCPRCR